MNNSQENAPRQADNPAAAEADAPAMAQSLALDLIALMRDLLDKAAGAQIDLINARRRGDQRGSDEALLHLRAATLLLASIPAPDPDARRFAVLAAALLAAEDDDSSDYARRMVEHAIRLGDDRFWTIETPTDAALTLGGTTV